MSGIARLGDLCTGHDGFKSRPIITASQSMTINGLGVASQGDLLDYHNKDNKIHNGFILTGSSNMTLSGRSVARIGDLVSCGGSILTGSRTSSNS